MLRRTRLLPLALAVLTLAACGKDEDAGGPVIGRSGDEEHAAEELGFPTFATKNTTRIGGGDPVADAAAVARAVYPGRSPRSRPDAVVLTPRGSWQTALAASVFMGRPIRAPLLLSGPRRLPAASAEALNDLDPGGSRAAGGAQLIRVGEVAKPPGRRSTDIQGGAPAFAARQIDGALAAATGGRSERVLVVSSERPEFAMPAAAWAAKSGEPILFATRRELPEDTRIALRRHDQPRIYVLGPPDVIGPGVVTALRRYGSVRRVGAAEPVANAVAFARYSDGRFGWGVIDPGHGFVFANVDRPLDAAAAAPLSASGSYGPLLLLSDADQLPSALEGYLLDVQPGFDRDPVRGVYNRGWIVGDDDAVSIPVQSRIDELLEIQPVSQEINP